MSDRLEWTIEKKFLWIATHNETGMELVGRTKAQLMSSINRYDKGNYKPVKVVNYLHNL